MILNGFQKNHFSEKVCGTRDPLETPPPFMAKTKLNFHFDYLIPSLRAVWLFRNAGKDPESLKLSFDWLMGCSVNNNQEQVKSQEPGSYALIEYFGVLELGKHWKNWYFFGIFPKHGGGVVVVPGFLDFFGLENPTFLAKSDIWIPKCTEGGGIHRFGKYS